MFPITLILRSSKVQDSVSDGILDITSARIPNVDSVKGVNGAGQSVSLFPRLPGSKYFCDAKPLSTW